jgi:tripartite-type tricarboxylate transporter receptor subunit TctC
MGRLLQTLAIILVICAQCIGSATALDWPTRPVTMVVVYAAGGSGDVTGRILAAGLSEVLGQPVIIENISGAGGQNGTNRVARSAPDGYQFVFADVGPIALSQTLQKKPPYDSATDLVPVALVATLPAS